MTIVQKWRQRKSSFADIAAAITEKGVSIHEGKGYNRYANAVRQIYSDVYTDEYEYPAQYVEPLKRAIPAAYALELVVWCRRIKEQIRQAIIDGGVDCDETVPLSEYGNKIRQISALEIVTTYIGFAYDVWHSAQLEAKGGTPPYTWSYVSGACPPGLSLSSDGILSGAPKNTGYYGAFCVACEDSEGQRIENRVDINVSSRTVTALSVGESEFVYDGQPHYRTFVCREVPELEIIARAANGDDISAGERRIYLSTSDRHYKISNYDKYFITIQRKQIVVTVAPQVYVYDGQPHAYQYTAEPEYTPLIMYKPINASDDEYTDIAPVEIGEYKIKISPADTNHSIVCDGQGCRLQIKETDNE